MPLTYDKQLGPTPARTIFAAALRAEREAQNLSQEGLADKAGLHRTYISQVEKGIRNVSIDNLEHLANALGVPLWKMLRPPKAS